MAKLADAADLKSAGPKGLWGFDSPSRHHYGEKRMIAAVDVGGAKLAVGMVDAHGQLLARAESPIAAEAGYSRW
jgi:hypothetical protein